MIAPTAVAILESTAKLPKMRAAVSTSMFLPFLRLCQRGAAVAFPMRGGMFQIGQRFVYGNAPTEKSEPFVIVCQKTYLRLLVNRIPE
jgi:hypothetical protein